MMCNKIVAKQLLKYIVFVFVLLCVCTCVCVKLTRGDSVITILELYLDKSNKAT